VLPCGIVLEFKCVSVGCAEMVDRRLRRSTEGSVHSGLQRAVKGGHEGLDDRRTKRPRMDHGHLALGIQKTQGREDDEDSIGQVDEHDIGIVVFGGGQRRANKQASLRLIVF
jgi:hypothetical protein